MYKIKEFAKLTGVSVRALHHYDEIGLLHPEDITESGYRLYGKKSLETMQQILTYKELEFSLDKIKKILKSKEYNLETALFEQKELIELKQKRLDKILTLIDKMIVNKGEIMEKDFHEAYAKEAEQKWGESDAYKESQRRYKSYSPEKLKEIEEEQTQNFRDLANLMDREISDTAVQLQVAKARDFITKYWYDCSLEIFEGLGQMYVADERFTKNIDKYGVGLAHFFSEAIAYYVKNNR